MAYLSPSVWANPRAYLLMLGCLVGLGSAASAQASLRTDKVLTQKLQQLTVGFEGEAGSKSTLGSNARVSATYASTLALSGASKPAHNTAYFNLRIGKPCSNNLISIAKFERL
jgi:hypothetical protein